jgi:hypothetical protein
MDLFDRLQPRRSRRFSSPLVLSRGHLVRPEWTDGSLLRQVIY